VRYSGWTRKDAVYALFFFDIHLDSRVVPDTDGVEVDDALSALRGCIESIEEGMMDAVDGVVVKNEHGEEIAWIKVSALRLPSSG
jgi:hypothetical protein